MLSFRIYISYIRHKYSHRCLLVLYQHILFPRCEMNVKEGSGYLSICVYFKKIQTICMIILLNYGGETERDMTDNEEILSNQGLRLNKLTYFTRDRSC